MTLADARRANAMGKLLLQFTKRSCSSDWTIKVKPEWKEYVLRGAQLFTKNARAADDQKAYLSAVAQIGFGMPAPKEHTR